MCHQAPQPGTKETAQGWMDARQEAPTQPTSGNLFVPEAGPSVWKLKNYCMTPEWGGDHTWHSSQMLAPASRESRDGARDSNQLREGGEPGPALGAGLN